MLARNLARSAGIVPVDIPFPINGLDQSMPRSQQVGLTCTEALNVCGFPPMSDRYGGGKCGGTRRAWNQQFTAAVGNNRILGMSSLTVATGAVAAVTDSIDRLYPWNEETALPASPPCWTIVGGSGTGYAAIDETPCDFDDTYIVGTPSNNPEFPNTIEWTFHLTAPVIVPSSEANVVFTYVYKMVDTAQGDGAPDTLCSAFIDVDLLCTETVVADFDQIDIIEASSGWVTISQVLTPTQIAAITAADPAWTHLRARVRCSTRGACLDAQFYVSQIEVSITDTTSGPNDPTGFRGKILVMNRGRCRVGILPQDMGSATLPTEEVSNPTDTDMVQDVPSISPFQGKWYCVDGVSSKIITPSAITTGTGSEPSVATWFATSGGSLPLNCRLTCVYSGRIVLARQEGASPNASIWYMSRVLDPLDWDFAADDAERPAETSAVAGTNEYLGQPADAITALIPSGDDYLIFGCSKSMWIMEGDPGSGGRIVNLSRQTGVLDSRAWCFDETGTLWFVGSSGLYKYHPSSGIVNVSGRKVYRMLDRLNASTTLIQLAYDAFRKEVMIFLTPQKAPSLRTAQRHGYTVFKEGEGTHLRYDIVRNAFFYRTFSWSAMGPWSVLEIQGSTDDDRTYLIGGSDGYIRRPFDGGYIAAEQRYGTADDMPRTGSTTTSANGLVLPITSSFRSAPIEWPGGTSEIVAVEITATGTDNNLPLALPLGPVRWRVLAANSPATVTEKSVDESAADGTWFDDADNYGFQSPVGMSVADGALQVTVSQPNNKTESWAMDRITLHVKRGGRRR